MAKAMLFSPMMLSLITINYQLSTINYLLLVPELP